MATSRSTLPTGYVLNDYEIVGVIGAGGFGITYRARDLALKRHFAIKEYSPFELSSRDGTTIYPYDDSADDYEKGLEDFLLEAETLARFSHPNIVGVARFFRANGTAYMVLNFEQGSSLKEWLIEHEGPVTQAELDAILGPLLEALQLIHGEGVLHRDIAPDNIYIRKNGTPVLLDFGSARQSLSRSHSMSAIVKAGYSPQEQYSSRASNQGPWTDIYSVAATIYRAVAGSVPPEASDRTVQDDYIPLARQRPAGFRQTFLAALDWAMELRPSDRPQSVEEWRAPLLKDKPVPARAKPADKASAGTVQRHGGARLPIWPTALVAAAFALLAGGSTWFYFNGQLETAHQETAAARETIQSLQVEAAAATRLAGEAQAEMEKLKVDAEVRDTALRQQISDSEGRAAALTSDLEAAKAAANNSNQIDALQRALEDERTRTAELERSIQANRSSLDAATRRYEDAEARAASAAADAEAEFKRNREALTDALAELKESQDAEETVRAEVKATQVKLASAQAAFTSDLDDLRSEKEASDARIRTLEVQLADEKTNADAASGDKSAAQARIGELQTQLDAERKKSDELVAENGKVVNRLNSTIGTLTDQLTAQNAEVKSAVTTLQEVRANAATEIAAAEKRGAEALNAAAAAEAALKKAQSEARDKERVAATAQTEVQEQVAELERRLQEANDARDAGAADAETQIKKLEGQLSDEKIRAADLLGISSKEKADADAEIARLTDQLTAEQAVLADARDAAAAAQAKSQELADEMSKRVVTLQGDLKTAALAESEAREALAAAKDLAGKDAVAAASQRDELQASIKALEQQIADQQATREALTAERDQIKGEADKRIAELEARTAELSAGTDAAVAAARSGMEAELTLLRNLGAVPSTRYAGLEVAPAEDSASFVVRSVEPTSPFADLLEPGMLIAGMSISGDALDFGDTANLNRISPAACDPISISVMEDGANRAITGRIPDSFGASRVGEPIAISVAGFAAVDADPLGLPLIADVDAGSIAETAGLQSGDHLVQFGGTSPADASAFATMVTEAAQRGGSVDALIERDCERQQVAFNFGDVIQNFDWASVSLSGTASTAPRIAELAPSSVFFDSGLQVGDQLNSVAAGGSSIDLPGEGGSQQQLAGLRLCGDVRVSYSRGTAAGSITVTMAPDVAGATPVDYSDFGFTGKALASGGVLVEALTASSPFASAGIAEGDVLTGVGPTTGPAVATIGDAARQRFLRQGGDVSIAKGCDTETITVAAYDPANDGVDLASLGPSKRRLVMRALHKLGHYTRGDMPAEFVSTGATDDAITEAMLAYRASQSESLDVPLSAADVQRLTPFSGTLMPGELEVTVLANVLPARVKADTGLIQSRMRLFAASKGHSDPDGRKALEAYQRAAGAAVVGYITTEEEARTIFNSPIELRPAPEARRQFGDWRVHEINNDCAIYSLPQTITGAFYRYTDNTSFSDRPAIWLKVVKAGSGQQSTQMNGDFGGAGSELDTQQPVTMVTDSGQRLATSRSRESIVPTRENEASSNALQKALVSSRWVEMVGTSKYGGELRIRYSASGFREAFDYLNNTCARGGLSPYLQ